MTAGAPSRRRTATVNRPEGERPSSRATASPIGLAGRAPRRGQFQNSRLRTTRAQ